ncbi:hypothetical protein YSY43_47920 [Paenibacillus sp. YSY-4.3]
MTTKGHKTIMKKWIRSKYKDRHEKTRLTANPLTNCILTDWKDPIFANSHLFNILTDTEDAIR